MSGLRAEDVKEALEAWGPFDPAHPVNDGLTQVQRMAIAAAARLWLASQEQTPDYEAAARNAYFMMHDFDTPNWDKLKASERAEWIGWLTIAVDAALVGFHPQDEGDERAKSPEVPT